MVSECGGVGDRWIRWRTAVTALLEAIDARHPAAPVELFEQLLASLTPRQMTQLRPLSNQQKDLFWQALAAHPQANPHVSQVKSALDAVDEKSPWATAMVDSAPLNASELPLIAVLYCARAIARDGSGVLNFPTWSVEVMGRLTWRGLTGTQIGVLDAWAEAHRSTAAVADAIDGALRVLDAADLNLSFPQDCRAILTKCAESGPQESVRDAVRALLAAVDARGVPPSSELASEPACKHERRGRGKDVPRVYGSWRSQICLDCGGFRTHGHNDDPDAPGEHARVSDWHPASEYAEATSEPEEH